MLSLRSALIGSDKNTSMINNTSLFKVDYSNPIHSDSTGPGHDNDLEDGGTYRTVRTRRVSFSIQGSSRARNSSIIRRLHHIA